MGARCVHVLCSKVVVVIDHMDPGDISDIIFGMSGLE